jgi:hypothetical protein
MVAGLGGTAALAANQGLRGQEKNTAVQEWTQWKQWALDHKDFEALRAERVGDWEKFKSRIESDEFAEEWSIRKEAIRKKEEELNLQEQKIFMKVSAVFVLAFMGICFIVWASENKKESSPQTSQILQPVELASQLT